MKKKTLFLIGGAIILLVGSFFIIRMIVEKNKTYEIIFDSNGGTVVEKQTLKKGESIKKPTNPQKEGFAFISWTYNNKTYDFNEKVDSNLTLTAQWQKINKEIETFIVEFDSDGGTTISNQVIEKDNQIQKPENPQKKGYTFAGWFLNDKEYDFNEKVDSNLTLKAKWQSKNNTKSQETSTKNQNNSTTKQETNTQNQKKSNSEQESSLITPTLTTPAGSPGYVQFSILTEGNYKNRENTSTIDGWELYEKVGATYKIIDSNTTFNGIGVNLEVGTTKTIVARVYSLNSKGEKTYSKYSNEVVIKEEVATPTLTAPAGSPGYVQFSIVTEGNYKNRENTSTIDGWELYKKVGTTYELVDSNTTFNGIGVNLDEGKTGTFVARAYALNSKSEKVYSQYSNELEINA